MTSLLKLELVAPSGEAPEAVLVHDRSHRQTAVGLRLARRLIGERGRHDAALSYSWGRTVWCTPEFSSWWRARTSQPTSRIFLQVILA